MTTTPQPTPVLTDADLDPLAGGIILNNDRGGTRRARQAETQRRPWWLRPTGQQERPWWVRPISKPADPV